MNTIHIFIVYKFCINTRIKFNARLLCCKRKTVHTQALKFPVCSHLLVRSLSFFKALHRKIHRLYSVYKLQNIQVLQAQKHLVKPNILIITNN